MKHLLLLFTSLIISFSSLAKEVPPLTRPVEDLAGVLNDEDKLEIEAFLRKLHEDKLAQVSVLIVSSLDGEVVEEYSMKVASSWKLGTAKRDNGALLLIAMNDRKMRLEVGQGLEGSLTDAESSRVIYRLGTYMRKQEFKDGILMVAQEIRKEIEYDLPEHVEAREKESALNEKLAKERMDALYLVLTVILVVGLWVGGGYNFYISFSKPPELRKTLEEQKQKRILETRLLAQERESQEAMVMNPDKLKYLKALEDQRKVENDLSERKSIISKMKHTLGEP